VRWRHKKEPTTVRREIRIGNPLGLHARPAAQFVRHANAFRSDVWLIKEDRRFSARSLIEVLRANLNCDDVATLEAHGVDAEEAVERLSRLLHEFNG
jgi:phosphotransferase system HPr (HPr) family protein